MGLLDTSAPTDYTSLKKAAGATSGTTSAAASYDGSKSIFETFATNAGDILTGAATLYSSIAGRSVAPTVNNYGSSAGTSMGWILPLGAIAVVLLIVLMIFKNRSN